MDKINYEDITTIRGRLLFLGFRSQLLTTRFLLALSEFSWAFILFFVTTTTINNTMSGAWWGGVFLSSALVQSYILLSGKFHNTFAVLFAGGNAALWWYVTIAMYLDNYPPSIEVSSILTLSVAASLVFIRSGYCLSSDQEQ